MHNYIYAYICYNWVYHDLILAGNWLIGDGAFYRETVGENSGDG